MRKRAVVSVSNDVTTDQRVAKICNVLTENGFDVLLIGRKRKDSISVSRNYRVKRLRLLFNRGALFYAEFNMRLFWLLLFSRCSLLYANDLDTLLPNFLISRIRRKPLLYDSHEYFTEVPELQGRRFARGTWLNIEKFVFPKLKYVLTVNKSIAEIYNRRYGVKVEVMRNIPDLKNRPVRVKTRQDLGLPEDKKIVILQGAGINVDRGAEELTEAMTHLNNCLLLIVGSGDVVPILKERVAVAGLDPKIRFIGKLPYEEMMQYTMNADLGVTLDKDTNLNYKYSLPNKIFDYALAGIPVLASDLVEVVSVINTYHIGVITPSHDPQVLAKTMDAFFADPDKYKVCKENTAVLIADLNWETECVILEKLLERAQHD